jgi:hypothetical protein
MLNIRPCILEGESLSSYLYRLLKANYHETISCFVTDLNSSYKRINNNEFDQSAIHKLSGLSGINTVELFTRTLNYYEKYFNESVYNLVLMKAGRVKYCPLCIKPKVHHKLLWSFHPVTVCLYHGNLLIDKCHNCKQRILMNDLMHRRCRKCDFDFTKASVRQVDKGSILYQSQINVYDRLLNNEGVAENPTDRLSLTDYFTLVDASFYLLEGLHSFIEPKNEVMRVFANQKHGGHDNYNFSIAYMNVFWMYQDFPNNFYSVLESFYNKHKDVRNYQKVQFEKLFINERFPWVKDSYEQYWMNQINAGKITSDFSVFKRDKSLLKNQKSMFKKEIRNRWGLDHNQINMLLEDECINSSVIYLGKNKRYVFDREEIEHLIKDKDYYISQQQALLLLGISKPALLRLFEAGYLQLKTAPLVKRKMIDRRDIESLLKRYEGQRIESEDIERIGLKKCFHNYSCNGLGIVELLKFIDHDQLRPYKESEQDNFSGLYFDKKELLKCVERLKEVKRKTI